MSMMSGSAMKRYRNGLFAVVLMAVAALLPSCTTKKPPVLEPLRSLSARRPVVLVPGLSGSQLRDRETGQVLWGNARSLFLPRDGGYSIANPLEPGFTALAEPFEPVYGFRLFGVRRIEAYRSLVRLMERNGYRYGDLAAPRRSDDFFLLVYDWRLSNIHAARELAEQLERLRRVRGEEVLTVDLICQSDAGRICRYLSRFGGVSLEEAENGAMGPPPGVRIGKVILVGTANGGALNNLRDLDRGRLYIPFGRRFHPEVLFTYSSLYEGLPAGGGALFLDTKGNRLEIDLFDPADWERYGWSIFGREAAQRVRRSGRGDLFGERKRRTAFLKAALGRAARLNNLLRRDTPLPDGIRYYMVQNAYDETPAGAVLVKEDGEWRTYFSGDRFIRKKRYLHALVSAPGDGSATVASQMNLSAGEKDALAAPPFLIRGGHFKMILDPAAQRRILEFLLE